MIKLDLQKIVFMSVLLTFAFYYVSNEFLEPLFWQYSVVSMAIFLVLYGLSCLYEKCLWKMPYAKHIFTLIGFQEYPNIVGRWEMEYFSSYKYDWKALTYHTIGKGYIDIEKIEGGFLYKGKFAESEFKSTSNFFERNKNNKKEWTLGYKYNNAPTNTDTSRMGFVSHYGFLLLEFDQDSHEEMKGFYGNDEDRKTRGKIILKRKP